MANILVLDYSWYASGNEDYLQSGEARGWTWGLGGGASPIFETVSVTAHPFRFSSVEYRVKVEGLQVAGGGIEVGWNFGSETSGSVPYPHTS